MIRNGRSYLNGLIVHLAFHYSYQIASTFSLVQLKLNKNADNFRLCGFS